MRQKKARKLGLFFLFMAYIVLMGWLLFGQRTHKHISAENLNIVPFTTLKLYIGILKNRTNDYLVRHAFINLAGNVIMFIPFGYFLPGIWKRAQGFTAMLVYSFVIIVLIETVQYITGLGSCDVDDLILNVPGVMLGWAIRHLSTKKHK